MSEPNVFINISALKLKELKDKYKAVDVDGLIEKKVKYYRLKPFTERSKVVWIEQIKEFVEIINENVPEEENKIDDIEKYSFVFEKESQAREFISKQPLFYDRSDMWWLWNKETLKWEIIDKTDILNGIKNSIGVNTINSKERLEILNALQQVGRENIPEEVPKECIQFKDKIINIKTGEEFQSNPKYFSTNPLPWMIGESEDTPTMDKFFTEWVGEDYVKTLYEVIAYVSCSEQFLQRMIALVGGGSNGKGTFIKLLKKFIGKENTSTSELSLLSINQFETSSIYKKLLCEMGEVSYDDLKNTNQLKKLTGEDDIRYCFKGKTPFTERNPTTCIINTNSLPSTPDKTLGFYRRWLIIDFPNQFPIMSGIIENIPDIEFENLSNKVIRILKEMYQTQKFTNEGDYQERSIRYEERSNPILRFIEECCVEVVGDNIPLREFTNVCNEFLKKRHLRILTANQIGKILRNDGFLVGQRKINDISSVVVLNLSFTNLPLEPLKPSYSQVNLHRETSGDCDGFNGFNGFSDKEIESAGWNKENLKDILAGYK